MAPQSPEERENKHVIRSVLDDELHALQTTSRRLGRLTFFGRLAAAHRGLLAKIAANKTINKRERKKAKKILLVLKETDKDE